jgi:hypothetical protein
MNHLNLPILFSSQFLQKLHVLHISFSPSLAFSLGNPNYYSLASRLTPGANHPPILPSQAPFVRFYHTLLRPSPRPFVPSQGRRSNVRRSGWRANGRLSQGSGPGQRCNREAGQKCADCKASTWPFGHSFVYTIAVGKSHLNLAYF